MRPMPLHQRFTPAPLTLAAAAAIAMATGHVPRAHAQSGTATVAATLVAINIPAQPLGAALNELARQANLQMTFPAPLVAGKQAPAVSGQMTGQQALARVLAGSGLVATTQGRSVVVKPQVPPAVHRDRVADGACHGSGSTEHHHRGFRQLRCEHRQSRDRPFSIAAGDTANRHGRHASADA